MPEGKKTPGNEKVLTVIAEKGGTFTVTTEDHAGNVWEYRGCVLVNQTVAADTREDGPAPEGQNPAEGSE